MQIYVIQTDTGYRVWQADDVEHALEQHEDAFGDDPNERVLGISIAVQAEYGDNARPPAKAQVQP